MQPEKAFDLYHYAEVLGTAARERVPLAVLAELTWRCVCRCRHCHVWPRAGAEPELPTGAWLRILDELSAAGTLFLTFSGGEPLLRDDLFTLIDRAIRLGTFVTVFTSGVVLTPDDAARLADSGVGTVEISFYSSRPEVYEAVTGVPGSFKRLEGNLRSLQDAGVPVMLKTPVTRTNYRSLPETFAWADDHGFPFRADFTVFPDCTGNACNHGEVLSETELEAAMRLAAPFQPQTAFYQSRPEDPVCYAGHRFCAIDPAGRLYGCTLMPAPAGDLTRERFADAWAHSPVLAALRGMRHGTRQACRNCELLPHCGRCPALSARTGGALDGVTDAVCREARVRARLAEGESAQRSKPTPRP
ncbi:MAG: radical SAM protein [Acidobacteria bacterium]|nr:radical SAM protein [Acidobacteriota bacterium]